MIRFSRGKELEYAFGSDLNRQLRSLTGCKFILVKGSGRFKRQLAGTFFLKKRDFCSAGSEHLAVVGRLGRNSKIKCCLKLKLTPDRKGVRKMHRKELLLMFKKYKYVEKNSTRYVTVNDYAIYRLGNWEFMVEMFIPYFRKFWSPKFSEALESMLNTDVEGLRRFQRKIYLKSGKKYTICDLQGGVDRSGRIRLTDIEFTDSMGKFYGDLDLLQIWKDTSRM